VKCLGTVKRSNFIEVGSKLYYLVQAVNSLIR